jgi:hypothetical protein
MLEILQHLDLESSTHLTVESCFRYSNIWTAFMTFRVLALGPPSSFLLARNRILKGIVFNNIGGKQFLN